MGEQFTAAEMDAVADARRQYEMSGRRLNGWDYISTTQRRKWREKANVALNALAAARTQGSE